MRNLPLIRFCAAIALVPAIGGTAYAHMMDNSMSITNAMSANSTTNGSVAGPRMNQNTDSDQYIVNPAEMTETRDNRGNIPDMRSSYTASQTPSQTYNSNGSNNRWNGAGNTNGSAY